MNKKNIAVILSGGSGTRFGSTIPKQFIMLGGKKIIEYTIDKFNTHTGIDEICLVINSSHEHIVDEIVCNNDFKKMKKVIYGGKERFESSRSAILAYADDENCHLIFHDAVRPFISHEIISRVIDALSDYKAIDVAIPATDTIIQVSDNQTISKIPERKYLQQGQTPQAFHYKTIKSAYKKAEEEDFTHPFTDDCGLITHYLPDEPVYVVEGDAKNIKITRPEDLLLAEKLLQLQSLSFTSHTKDFPQLLNNKIIVIFGGNSGIGKKMVELCQKHDANVVSFSKSEGTDINEHEMVSKALESVYKKYNKIDFVINTVGVLTRESLSSMTDKKIDEVLDTNLKGTITITQKSFPYLKESQGHLLLFTSSSYTRGRSGYSLYSATKAAIVNFMQAIAQEWAAHHIKINAINPSRTDTPMRTKNFGFEPKNTLLDAGNVASIALSILFEDFSGQVIDIKKD